MKHTVTKFLIVEFQLHNVPSAIYLSVLAKVSYVSIFSISNST